MSDSIALDAGVVMRAYQTNPINDAVRAKSFVSYLIENKQRIVIPAPVVTEYLNGVSVDLHEKHMELLQKHVFIAALNAPAAKLAAKLSRLAADRGIQQSSGTPRQLLKYDVLVVAVAIVAKCDRLVTTDKHMRELANGEIEVVGIPSQDEQGKFDFL